MSLSRTVERLAEAQTQYRAGDIGLLEFFSITAPLWSEAEAAGMAAKVRARLDELQAEATS